MRPKEHVYGYSWWIDVLTGQASDKAVFDFGDVPDVELYRREAEQILAHLYDTAALAWNEMLGSDLDVPARYAGAQIFEERAMLGTRWIESFAAAIRRTARHPQMAAMDRRFLYFMLGMLSCARQEHVRQLAAKRNHRCGGDRAG